MEKFVTDLFLLSSRSNDDTTTYILDTTTKGYDGNLYETSWRHKGKRLIGFKKNESDDYIVTDMTVISEDQDVPDDYAGVLITKDTKEKGLKKHILCYSRNPRNTTKDGITEIVLVNSSKSESVPPLFTSAGEKVNDIQICFKTEKVLRAPPPRPAVSPPVRNEQLQQYGNISPSKAHISAIEGVPFQINPKFNTQSNTADPLIGGISFVAVDDIAQKYKYSFNLEREVIDAT